MGDDTAVVSLQNGVDNEERLAAVLGDDWVVGGAAYIFATIAAPGVIDHTGGPASVVVDEWRGGDSQRVTSLVSRSERSTSPPTTRRTSVRCCGAELSGQN